MHSVLRLRSRALNANSESPTSVTCFFRTKLLDAPTEEAVVVYRQPLGLFCPLDPDICPNLLLGLTPPRAGQREDFSANAILGDTYTERISKAFPSTEGSTTGSGGLRYGTSFGIVLEKAAAPSISSVLNPRSLPRLWRNTRPSSCPVPRLTAGLWAALVDVEFNFPKLPDFDEGPQQDPKSPQDQSPEDVLQNGADDGRVEVAAIQEFDPLAAALTNLMVVGNTSGVDNSKDNRGRRLREEKTATLQEPQEAAPPELAPAPPSHSTVGGNASTLLRQSRPGLHPSPVEVDEEVEDEGPRMTLRERTQALEGRGHAATTGPYQPPPRRVATSDRLSATSILASHVCCRDHKERGSISPSPSPGGFGYRPAVS
ncbi:hypothetical protein B0H13DRAFT_1952232 [Mycena leptocephala]|nr:hypothetical protein B0H13DRAFT_1952232 [Mycena leptocephala]